MQDSNNLRYLQVFCNIWQQSYVLLMFGVWLLHQIFEIKYALSISYQRKISPENLQNIHFHILSPKHSFLEEWIQIH